MAPRTPRSANVAGAGRLRIGDDWNAIHIIALSQSNPLKAVAEFVENSIDARATKVTIIRGRDRGRPYLKIIDDGEGVPRDDQGRPNFKHVATHICDSLKRQIKARGAAGVQGEVSNLANNAENPAKSPSSESIEPQQRQFFEHAGPLASVRIAPSMCVVGVGQSKRLRAVARDRSGRQVDNDMTYAWHMAEGAAELTDADREIVTLTAPAEPQLVRITVAVRQCGLEIDAEALVSVTDSLLPERPQASSQRGLPEYAYEKRPGDLWRSRYDAAQNIVVVNSGHRDFVFAARNKTTKLRYLCRLFAKELVLHNFPGYGPDQLLERMIELSLYTESHLQ